MARRARYLAAISPAVHRLTLELTDRLAAAISDTTDIPPEIATLQGIALAGVPVIIQAGRRTREGHSQTGTADGLYPIVSRLLSEIDRWLAFELVRIRRQLAGGEPVPGGDQLDHRGAGRAEPML